MKLLRDSKQNLRKNFMRIDMKKAFQSILLGTGAKVRVAVIDSGVNPQFPALRGRTGRVIDCSHGPKGLLLDDLAVGSNSDRTGHGSLVQSCLVSVAPEAQVDHFRVLDENNVTDSSLLCYVLDHAIDQKYNVINVSLGTSSEHHLPWLVALMKRAYESNVVVVAACSNVGNWLYPATFTYCVSVNAMPATHAMQVRFHPGSVVEFSGLGVNVPIAGPADQSIFVTGSSYAAAHISGLCARILEIRPESSPLDVKLILREFAISMGGGSQVA
jgi:subtilisin family serine protease